MAKDRDSDSGQANGAGQGAQSQSKRPPLNQHVSQDSDSQISDHASTAAHLSHPRLKKHVVGGSRMHHGRVPSSKALHKNHASASTSRLNRDRDHQSRRPASPSPERASEDPERPSMLASTHRRSTSDALRLPARDSSLSSNLKKNTSQTSLKRNRSLGEVAAKRSKSGAHIKRSLSSKEVDKLAAHKSTKSQVHFDLGNEDDGDGQTDEGEWVDASASASPYLSRRGSVVSSGQSSAKGIASGRASPKAASPRTAAAATSADAGVSEDTESGAIHDQAGENGAERERIQHKQYLTSRLLQRTPSHGAPPMMSSDTAQVAPRPGSPDSPASRQSSTVFGTPRTGSNSAGNTFVGSSKEGLTSRFVSGNSSGQNAEAGSFYSPPHAQKPSERVKRPRSLGNLQIEHKVPQAEDGDEDDGSVLAPRSRRTMHKAPPADQTRTQQKLNLQRASSSMEPTQTAGGVGTGGVVVGSLISDSRDPRAIKLMERTGQEYLNVRRYQNPIARSLARLERLREAGKTQPIPKPNGLNGATHGKKHPAAYGLSGSLADSQKSRPTTPRRPTSVRTNGAGSSFEAEDHERMSGSSYVVGGGEDGGGDDIQTILRNLWDKSLDLSASQD